MATVHEAATRNAISDAVLVDIDKDASPAYLQFVTSGDVEVATITFDATSGTVSGAVLTFSSLPKSDTNATGGTIDTTGGAEIYDGNDVLILTTDVASPSGGSINISSLVIGAGDTVTLSSLTYTAPT